MLFTAEDTTKKGGLGRLYIDINRAGMDSSNWFSGKIYLFNDDAGTREQVSAIEHLFRKLLIRNGLVREGCKWSDSFVLQMIFDASYLTRTIGRGLAQKISTRAAKKHPKITKTFQTVKAMVTCAQENTTRLDQWLKEKIDPIDWALCEQPILRYDCSPNMLQNRNTFYVI